MGIKSRSMKEQWKGKNMEIDWFWLEKTKSYKKYSSDAVGLYVPVHDGIDSQSRYGADIEFFHDVLAVGDNGGSADTQVVGNFLVRQSAYNEYEHFYLALTESVGSVEAVVPDMGFLIPWGRCRPWACAYCCSCSNARTILSSFW